MKKLVMLSCFELEILITESLSFCLFVAITDKSHGIITEFDIIIFEIFFQYSEVQMAKFLVTWCEIQLYTLYLLCFRFFVNFVLLENVYSC